MFSKWRWRRVAVSLLALVIAGCAATASATDPDDAATPENSANSNAVIVESENVSIPTPPRSLLRDYLDILWGWDPALSPAEQNELSRQRQAQEQVDIASCMLAAGWDYWPFEPPTPPATEASSWYLMRPFDRDWVAQWGWGSMEFSRWWNEYFELQRTIVDPNAEFQESLSTEARQAYLIQLSACQQQASEAQFEVGGTNLAHEFDDIWTAMADFQDNLRRNGAFVEVESDWIHCVADAGFPGFTSPSQMHQSFLDRMNGATNRWNMDVFYYGDAAGPLTDFPAFAELWDIEVEMALASFDCRLATDFYARQAEITREAELQFIADNRPRLDALIAAAEQHD